MVMFGAGGWGGLEGAGGGCSDGKNKEGSGSWPGSYCMNKAVVTGVSLPCEYS